MIVNFLLFDYHLSWVEVVSVKAIMSPLQIKESNVMSTLFIKRSDIKKADN